MLFNSWTFAVFFVLVFGAYWALKHHRAAQNVLLLVASYLFYGWWDARFLSLIALATYTDYCTSLLIDRGRLGRRQVIVSTAYLLGMVTLCSLFRWPALWDGEGGFLLIDLDHGWPVLAAGGFVAVFLGGQSLPRWMKRPAAPRYHLAWCVVVNLGILAIFKYLGFFAENLVQVWAWLTSSPPPPIVLNIVLPVGISFFTFQTLSHAADVYRKEIPATTSLVDLATYIAFFPQLVAGPIERGAHLLPQFEQPRTVRADQCRTGLWLIFWGLYKKVVIADNVARLVNATFGPYDSLAVTTVPGDALRTLVAIYAFAVQIYCDFSGYTDIARGTARLLGFDIMLNFNLPYIASTPSDFWRRWHISLSSWLRDYLYIPLGGNRKGPRRTYVNLLLTMILGGLWHGAAWTFVLWGVFHGAILVVYRFLGIRGDRQTGTAMRWVKGVILFHLVCFGWLLFRAQNLTTVGLFLRSLAGGWHDLSAGWLDLRQLLFYSWFLLLVQIWQATRRELDPLRGLPWFVRLNIWVFLLTSLIRLAPVGHQEFIYFAF